MSTNEKKITSFEYLVYILNSAMRYECINNKYSGMAMDVFNTELN